MFQIDDAIRYYVEIYNNTGSSQSDTHRWEVTGPCGTLENSTFTDTDQTGTWYWHLPSTLASACPGEYTYTFTLTYNGTPTSLATTFTVDGATWTPTFTPTNTLTPSITPTPISFAQRAINKTNYYRVQFGCQPLVLNSALMSAAQLHAEDMALNDFGGHIGSNGSTLYQRIQAAGYPPTSLVGENAGWYFSTPEEMVDVWFNETPPNDGHRRNILNCAFTEIEVGYYYLPNDTGSFNWNHYWVQDFGSTGTPLPPPTFTPTLTPTYTPYPTFAPTNTPVPSITPTPTQIVASEYRTTIEYAYDPLYRLTSANYTGAYTSTFTYAYDSVGNRLTQTIDGVVTNYAYDNANRLTNVNGQAYTWDNNGNLLNDGVVIPRLRSGQAPTYNQANRLVSVTSPQSPVFRTHKILFHA